MEETIKKLNPWLFEHKLNKDYFGITRVKYLDEISKYLQVREIILLTGVRRSGKSTLMYQLIEGLLNANTPKENICYFNFDVPIENNLKTIELIVSKFKEITNPQGKIYFFLDEIQVIKNWHTQIKAIYDTNPEIKFILTGSNNSLLKSNTSKLLTGRLFHIEIFPLSFSEYLDFNDVKTIKKEELKFHFNNFVKKGGFPEVVKEKSELINEKRHRDYYAGILFRDVLSSGKIKEESKLKDLGLFCSTNVGVLFSYNKISRAIGLSLDSVKEYLYQMESAYLLFQLTKYSYSVKESIQIQAQRKIYYIDSGLRNTLTFSFSKNSGRILENLIFIELKRRNKEIFYHKDKKECDFVIRQGLEIAEAIQVCYELTEENRKRELEGLKEAMKKYKLKQGLIITNDQEETIKEGTKTINIVPAWKWLLEY